jgi:hypothetical protein
MQNPFNLITWTIQRNMGKLCFDLPWSGSIGVVMTIQAFPVTLEVAIVGLIFCLGGAVSMGFRLAGLVTHSRENELHTKEKHSVVIRSDGRSQNRGFRESC